jgi:hypothetical protein
MTVSISGTGGITFDDNSVQNTAATGFGFKNRLINSAMVIDQRNAGASVTITDTSNVTYTLDRWSAYGNVASKFSVQQDAGAVTPPVGFNDYLGVTSLSVYSVTGSDSFSIRQNIEGFNIADLGWGTANAKTVTLSFWVRSSLTGTFGGSLRNSAANRSYPFTYTINAANTWEYESITITGDTTGTWLTTNGTGIQLLLGLGVASTFSGTAGAWAAANYISATGATSVVGTNGATFYITGVQLEKGSTATSFDYRPYGTEFMLCTRYGLFLPRGAFGRAGSATQIVFFTSFNMRSAPTASLLSGSVVADNGSAGATATSPTNDGISASDNGVRLFIGGFSGLTTGTVFPLSSGDKIFLSAEL